MTQTDREKNFFKISLVLNAVIMSTFLALNTITNLGNRDIWLTTTYFLVSAMLMILANFVIYKFWVRRNT
jgi:hypothetical protein